MELGTTLLGAGIGAAIGAVKTDGDPWKYALWGGLAGFVGTLVLSKTDHGVFRVGQLPQSLPTPGLPGQLVYNLDPRRDPLLDPVSREQLYPVWLLWHWQSGDRKVIADAQRAFGLPADGVVGGATMSAVRALQVRAGLPATGIMDLATMEALILG